VEGGEHHVTGEGGSMAMRRSPGPDLADQEMSGSERRMARNADANVVRLDVELDLVDTFREASPGLDRNDVFFGGG